MTFVQMLELLSWDIRINLRANWDSIRATLLLVELRLEQYIYRKTHEDGSIAKQVIWFLFRGIGSIYQWFLCNSNIPGSVTIGKGLRLPHPQNIVISRYTVIGDFCTIYHNVSISWSGFSPMIPNSPKIGDKVLIGTNAIIIGDLVVGSDVLIGAGALVVKSVPDHSRVTATPSVIEKRVSTGKAAHPGSQRHLNNPYSIWR